ncbi:HxlR family transcriptional regulator [Roseivirga sp. 4D4]|uniref:winged helix-turn-helix transcriptional regulator n=1 Tax=Roseivirga sp. 4D4 TaxID=1889784 RepID=UPI0008534E38|nr:helix-turn-helix domain-containing protein [Roseivirga sp. 4D4]OEK00266.1 HxlR family transcriptional regulator [Roseivirga sp. 4D4]
MKQPRSHCPQNLILEVIGDKWTLLIIRDMILEGKRYFREFLQSEEKIASNILSNRLKSLEEEGIIWKEADPDHKQKIRYSLTQKGIDLFPIMMENAKWSLKYKPVNDSDAIKAQAILDKGQEGIRAVMKSLKSDHLKGGKS